MNGQLAAKKTLGLTEISLDKMTTRASCFTWSGKFPEKYLKKYVHTTDRNFALHSVTCKFI